MKIKILPGNKKGATQLIEKHFTLIKHLIQKYPNAFWKKIRGKNGEVGYELDV